MYQCSPTKRLQDSYGQSREIEVGSKRFSGTLGPFESDSLGPFESHPDVEFVGDRFEEVVFDLAGARFDPGEDRW